MLRPDLAPLANLFDRPEPRVVVVVGAGVSIGATHLPYASWEGLLSHAITYLETHRVFHQEYGARLRTALGAAFRPFRLTDVLTHAELVESALSNPATGAWGDWLAAVFRDFKARDDRNSRATLEAIRDLQQAGALVLTTNYDSLLTDATGLPPVTWEEHERLLMVLQRRQPAILHIHGHWQRPTSIVLGRSSYDRVVADQHFQQVFRTLWIDYSWVYVGSGDGLDDPNLGRLLEWGKTWGAGAMPDYFLALADRAVELVARPDRPSNLVAVGYAEHGQLPQLLRSVAPAARCGPFVPIDEEFHQFRTPGSNVPFPTLEEYRDGVVPSLEADTVVRGRLEEHGWAFVLDFASIGKTTLALRIATNSERRGRPAYHIDLAGEILGDDDRGPIAALDRLTRWGVLLIVDNAHHRPDLARRLWNQWRDRRRDSHMLIVATRIERATVVSAEWDLAFFEAHPTNPAVTLRPTAGDLVAIARHIYRRVGGPSAPPMPTPPPEVSAAWYRDFGTSLAAFTIAVTGHLAEFRRGRWELPLSAASAWVRLYWLAELDSGERANLVCLSACGAQRIELQVPTEGLPDPQKIERLSERGLVVRIESGQFRQYRHYVLREPGWGSLILAAIDPPIDEEAELLAVANRSPQLAVALSRQLRKEGLSEVHRRLWATLAANDEGLLTKLADSTLSVLYLILQEIRASGQGLLFTRCWETVESQFDKIVVLARESSLSEVGRFLKFARRHGRDTAPLWDALLGAPGQPDVSSKLDALAVSARSTPLEHIGSFLKVAGHHGRDTAPLWDALLGTPGQPDFPAKLDAFAASAQQTLLGSVGSFLEVARQHGRDTAPFWDALLGAPSQPDVQTKLDDFAISARRTPLAHVSSFLEIARQHGRDTASLWDAFLGAPGQPDVETKLDGFAASARQTSLENIGSFLEVARRHGRDTARLWDAFLGAPGQPDTQTKLDSFAVSALQSPIEHIGSLLEVARKHGRDTAPLWDALLGAPGQPDVQTKLGRFATCVWTSPLDKLSAFVATAHRHGRDIGALWARIEQEPKRLQRAARTTHLANLSNFARHAPPSIFALAMTHMRPEGWASVPPEDFNGATWVAAACLKAGRNDLGNALILMLFRRAEWQTLDPKGGGFGQVAWLLGHVPENAAALVDPFLARVCNDPWMRIAYARTSYGGLAKGLRQVALHQTVERCRHFHHPGLGTRLERAFAAFERVDPLDQSQIVQLMGSAVICGWAISPRSLTAIRPSSIAQLPVHIGSHQNELGTADFQYQKLWLGLRAFISITRRNLLVPRRVTAEMCDRWRVEKAESSSLPFTPRHRIACSMVSWLEACLRERSDILVPSADPLWIFVGFPKQL